MLYIKTPSPLQKSTKEQKMIENSQFLLKVPKMKYTFTSNLYSSWMKCNILNYNFNTILEKENLCIHSYNWTDENDSNINVDHK